MSTTALSPERIKKAIAASGHCFECGSDLAGVVWKLRRQPEGKAVPWRVHCELCALRLAPAGTVWAAPRPCVCGRLVVQPEGYRLPRIASCGESCYLLAHLAERAVDHPPRPCRCCDEDFLPTRADQETCGECKGAPAKKLWRDKRGERRQVEAQQARLRVKQERLLTIARSPVCHCGAPWIMDGGMAWCLNGHDKPRAEDIRRLVLA
jgi:hypothetical protein